MIICGTRAHSGTFPFPVRTVTSEVGTIGTRPFSFMLSRRSSFQFFPVPFSTSDYSIFFGKWPLAFKLNDTASDLFLASPFVADIVKKSIQKMYIRVCETKFFFLLLLGHCCSNSHQGERFSCRYPHELYDGCLLFSTCRWMFDCRTLIIGFHRKSHF